MPVNFTFTYPANDPATKMPVVMLLNGANVESFWYRRLVAQLASGGYVVASSNYYRSFKVSTPQLPSNSRSPCSEDHQLALFNRQRLELSLLSCTCSYMPAHLAKMIAEMICPRPVQVAWATPGILTVNLCHQFIVGRDCALLKLPDCRARVQEGCHHCALAKTHQHAV